jgi:hypothetical protein
VPCPICGIRKPRRLCPAKSAEICSQCCAEGREETIDCPIGCEFLHDAHRHESKPEYDASKVPNLDVNVTEQFLAQHEVLLAFLAIAVFEGAMGNSALTDYDIREAFETLIQNYKSAKSGIIFESRPVNTYAAAVVDHVAAKVTEVRERETASTGATTIDDLTLIRILAFLQRLEYSHNNGRKKCRAFLDFLSSFYSPMPADEAGGAETSEPEEPLIIS